MISLTQARAKFFEANAPDHLALAELERKMGLEVLEAIEHGEPRAEFEVPSMMYGAYGLYDIDEAALSLLRRAKEQGYTARMIGMRPNIIELSGWAPKVPHSGTKKPKAPRRNTKPKGPEITMNDVRRGVLSSRLRRRVSRFT